MQKEPKQKKPSNKETEPRRSKVNSAKESATRPGPKNFGRERGRKK